MTEFWESSFRDKQMMWGEEPALSAIFAVDHFELHNVRDVLIPGIGYGRNAKPFLDAGMTVTGIEISLTAIDLAGSVIGLDIPIYHGSVSDMPFDDRQYDGIFCYALIHLLGDAEREKLIRDCFAQLKPGGHMIFTVISKEAPAYGSGTQIGTDRFEMFGGVQLFFYDNVSIQDEFGKYGLVEFRKIDDRSNSHGQTLPFFNIVCRKG